MSEENELIEEFARKGFDPSDMKIGYPFYQLNLTSGQTVYIGIKNNAFTHVVGEFQYFTANHSKINLKRCKIWDSKKAIGTKIFFKQDVVEMKIVGENGELLEVPKVIPEKKEVKIKLETSDVQKKHWIKTIEKFTLIDDTETFKATVERLSGFQVVGVGAEFDSKDQLRLMVLTLHNQIYIVGKQMIKKLEFLKKLLICPTLLKVTFNSGKLIDYLEKFHNLKFSTFVDLKFMIESGSTEKKEQFRDYICAYLNLTSEEVGQESYADEDLDNESFSQELILDMSYKWGYLLPLYEAVMRSEVLDKIEDASMQYANTYKFDTYAEVISKISVENDENLTKVLKVLAVNSESEENDPENNIDKN